MITAICEMADQACGIEDVRLIENTPKAIQDYEDEMTEMMAMFGFQLFFYNTEYVDIDEWTEEEVYAFMRQNGHLEIDV